nr:protein exordium-like 7 [Quercus suber]
MLKLCPLAEEFTESCIILTLFAHCRKKKMELEVVKAELVLLTHLSFKQIQMYEKYPKGQSRGRHWKHLKQILQVENHQNYPPDEPNCKPPASTNGGNNIMHAPNGDVGADGMISVIAHELAEVSSNPLVNAWYAGDDPTTPTEIANLCVCVYGSGGGGGYVGKVFTDSWGNGYNVNGVKGRRFLVQWRLLTRSTAKFSSLNVSCSADVNIESPPSMHPCKRICDITGYEAPYYDPRTNLRYANADVFKLVRSLPKEYVQSYLALRNAAVVLK